MKNINLKKNSFYTFENPWKTFEKTVERVPTNNLLKNPWYGHEKYLTNSKNHRRNKSLTNTLNNTWKTHWTLREKHLQTTSSVHREKSWNTLWNILNNILNKTTKQLWNTVWTLTTFWENLTNYSQTTLKTKNIATHICKTSGRKKKIQDFDKQNSKIQNTTNPNK